MRPLEGIRVVDLTRVLAGPFATHQLCMMGADVIKVEQPGLGDQFRSLETRPDLNGFPPGFVAANCGKRSVAVDLKSRAGKDVVEKLVATSDVFVENFRPGVAAKLGFTPEHLHSINPRLVYCSISGWGQVGPNSGRPAYDHVIQAATGMMSLQGDGENGAPVKVGFPLVDTATGMLATTAIVSALLQRSRGDKAPIILDVSMVDASALLMAANVANYWLTRTERPRFGNRGFVGSPGADMFRASDGWIATGANTLRQFRSMCAVLGRPDILEDKQLLPKLPQSEGASLTDLATDALHEEIEKALLTDTAEAWEEKLAAVGVPVSKVRTLSSFLDGPYMKTGRVDAELPFHPLGGTEIARVLHEGFRSTGGTASKVGPPPRIGEHTEEVLREFGIRLDVAE